MAPPFGQEGSERDRWIIDPSFGPSLDEVRAGLDRLEEMIRAAKG